MSVNVVWFRRDLRLSDNPALHNATQNGKPIIPLFILDEHTDNAGAAFKWRLGLSIESLSLDLEKHKQISWFLTCFRSCFAPPTPRDRKKLPK